MEGTEIKMSTDGEEEILDNIIITGPPGTGKTVVGVQLMKVLLANKDRTEIGPILTICFTNHALDQFLVVR